MVPKELKPTDCETNIKYEPTNSMYPSWTLSPRIRFFHCEIFIQNIHRLKISSIRWHIDCEIRTITLDTFCIDVSHNGVCPEHYVTWWQKNHGAEVIKTVLKYITNAPRLCSERLMNKLCVFYTNLIRQRRMHSNEGAETKNRWCNFRVSLVQNKAFTIPHVSICETKIDASMCGWLKIISCRFILSDDMVWDWRWIKLICG